MDPQTLEQQEGMSPKGPRVPPVAGAGANPSTWVGVYVLGSVAFLAWMRRSFRRFT